MIARPVAAAAFLLLAFRSGARAGTDLRYVPTLEPRRYADGWASWPLEPLHEQHPVRGSFEEIRRSKDKPIRGLYHNGVDIGIDESDPDPEAPPGRVRRVFAIEGGTVWDTATDGTCNGRVRIGHFGYGHVHPAVKPGDRIKAGEFIGWSCKDYWHIHLTEFARVSPKLAAAEKLSTLDPLLSPKLRPFVDTRPPEIPSIRFYTPAAIVWDEDPAPGKWVLEAPAIARKAGKRLWPDQLRGVVDARALIADPQSFQGFQTGRFVRLQAPHHPYRVAIAVSSLADGRVVLQRDVFRTDGTLGEDAAMPIPFDAHYAPGSRETLDVQRCLARTGKCGPVYWFRLFAGPNDAFWDTRKLPNGSYRLKVDAWDAVGNQASRTVDVRIRN